MAELLVKAVNATHLDSDKNIKSCYKQGDIIGVAPNGYEWGALELKAPADGGKFVVIKIIDVTRQQVINWVKNHWDWILDGNDLDDDMVTLVRRRRIRIDVDLLPAGVLSTLNNTGEYSNTWANIRQYIRNKKNNETASGSDIE